MQSIKEWREQMSREVSGEVSGYCYRYWGDGVSEWKNGEHVMSSKEGAWQAIQDLEIRCRRAPGSIVRGYIAYELGVEGVLGKTKTLGIPLVHLVYSSPNGVECMGGRVARARDALLSPFSPPTLQDYERAVQRILDYLKAGDAYEVNYTQRFCDRTALAAAALYARLERANPAPYAAYLDCGEFQILSSSPELFLHMVDREIRTSPIKGTRPRRADPEADRREAADLLASEKEGAELLMICDLERHDLGQLCETGSVRVDCLKEVQSFATVHHLLSRISGVLRPDISHTQALRTCFPGGSITGAPKKRAMEIIDELETTARGVYTGCIGYMRQRPDGVFESQWNIAIRTLCYQDGLVHYGSGGAITVDSTPEAEYEELLVKVRALAQAF